MISVIFLICMIFYHRVLREFTWRATEFLLSVATKGTGKTGKGGEKQAICNFIISKGLRIVSNFFSAFAPIFRDFVFRYRLSVVRCLNFDFCELFDLYDFLPQSPQRVYTVLTEFFKEQAVRN